MKKKILFVDDDSNLLQGLERMLLPMDDQWQMDFALGGKAALSRITEEAFDVIVSDMRMPEIDGATLLQEVRVRSPQTVRIVLTGQADEDAHIRALDFAHQCMSKPCDVEGLRARITKAGELSELLQNRAIAQVVSQVSFVGSYPANYERLVELLSSTDEPSVDTVADIVSRDVAMTAKVLQITNSAFFGHAGMVNNAVDAVAQIGIERLRRIVQETSAFNPSKISSGLLSLETLTAHSVAVAKTCKIIAGVDQLNATETKEAVTTGVLHEIGRILLAAFFPEEYAQLRCMLNKSQRTLYEIEVEIFGASHTEIGAYLLTLWGLPNSIVDAVAHHHRPTRGPGGEFNTLSVLHAANAIEDELHPRSWFDPKIEIDARYIASLDKRVGVEEWKQAVKSRASVNGSK